jgi:hypothetical protein
MVRPAPNLEEASTARWPPRLRYERMKRFAWCILGGDEPGTPGEEGLRDQPLIEAIHQ